MNYEVVGSLEVKIAIWPPGFFPPIRRDARPANLYFFELTQGWCGLAQPNEEAKGATLTIGVKEASPTIVTSMITMMKI